MSAIRKHLAEFIAVVALLLVAVGVGGYILSQQRLRFPLIEEEPFTIEAELDTAQAVQPGQGQTVRVAGVQVGQIGEVQLEDGVAVVDLELDPKHEDLIREDATALLRTKTGLKDMFIEVDPGDGERIEENGRIRVENTLPDIDPDEILSALDADTRDYLRLLIVGAGKGLAGRGSDLQEALARLGPVHRDLAKATGAIARRRRNLRRLIHNYGMLVRELGRNGDDLRRLVRAADATLSAFAAEDANISEAVRRLPGALQTTAGTLIRVDRLGRVLGPALDSLRPPFRRLVDANRRAIPFLREATPIVRDRIRPFVREARPFIDDLGSASEDLVRAGPDVRRTLLGQNRLFNIGAHNPGGREGLSGNLARDRARVEGYLYWLAWTAQTTLSMFSTSDAQGPWRRFYLGGALSCGGLRALSLPKELRAAEQQLPSELVEVIRTRLGVAAPTNTQIIGGLVDILDQNGICGS
jgi:phospholipid/cholesterol/gamma-HCH transport system substrate-binding protein